MTHSFGDGIALHEPAQGSREDEPRPAHDASSYVLVVDDEELVRDFIARCLEDRGYAVKKAGNAAEALELMVNKPASVVLSDIKMPDQDGLWLADRLRAHWPNTPVIMATGIDDVETVRQSREVGAVDYITKPIARDQLLKPFVGTAPERANPLRKIRAPPKSFQRAWTKVEAIYLRVREVSRGGEKMTNVRASAVREQVKFTSTLPRRDCRRVSSLPSRYPAN